jgi:hypothetical protein
MVLAASSEQEIQQQAMAGVFANAVQLLWWDRAGPGPRTRTRASLDAEVRDLEALARRIRDDAARLTALGGSSFAPALERAAGHCDLQADMVRRASRNDPLIVQRHSDRLGGAEVQGFIIDMAEHFNAFFGKRMLGLVAIMANVAFERMDLTEDRIRGVFPRKRAKRPWG